MNAEQWNAMYPVGTPVFAYPGAHPEDIPSARRLVTRTRTAAQLSASGDPVVWVEGEGSYICLTHVDPVSETAFEAAKKAEQTAAAIAAAKPKPASDDPRDVEIARLRRKVASLKAEQDRDDAEYAQVIKERDAARDALREATDQIAALESDLGGAMARVAELEAERRTTNEALDDAVQALRADRDQLARYEERLETLRALCDAAEHIGLVSGGWFTVEAIRRATDGEPLPKPDITAHSYFRPAAATTQTAEEAS